MIRHTRHLACFCVIKCSSKQGLGDMYMVRIHPYLEDLQFSLLYQKLQFFGDIFG